MKIALVQSRWDTTNCKQCCPLLRWCCPRCTMCNWSPPRSSRSSRPSSPCSPPRRRYCTNRPHTADTRLRRCCRRSSLQHRAHRRLRRCRQYSSRRSSSYRRKPLRRWGCTNRPHTADTLSHHCCRRSGLQHRAHRRSPLSRQCSSRRSSSRRRKPLRRWGCTIRPHTADTLSHHCCRRSGLQHRAHRRLRR